MIKSIKYFQASLKHEIVNQAAKYSIVGGVCTILDFALLFIVTHYLGVNYIISSMISFLVATILNYYLCVSWIFKFRAVKKKYQEFLFYLVISGVGLTLNTVIIWGVTEFLGYYFMVSKIFATGLVFVWNFGARKYFLHSNLLSNLKSK